MEDLQARFLPQFITTARDRIDRVREIVARRDPPALGAALRELHSLVGEASLLGLCALVPLARETEAKAHRLRESGTDLDSAALHAALDELSLSLELVSKPQRGEGEP